MKEFSLSNYCKELKESAWLHLGNSRRYFSLPRFAFCLSLIFLPVAKLFPQVVNPGNSGIIQDSFGDVPYLPSPRNSVFVSGNYAYVVAGNGLEVVDVTLPGLPLHKGSLTNGTGGALLLGPKSIYVSGNYANVASNGSHALEIIDISNPAAPVHKGSLTNGSGGALLNAPWFVFVSGNYAYVTNNTDVVGGSLEIIDISNPAVPVHKGSITDGTGGAMLNLPYSVYVSGNLAYVASRYSNALEIVDISNPVLPVHKSGITNSTGGASLSGPVSVFVLGNYAYVASYGTTALEIVDVTNPALPVHKGSIGPIGGTFANPLSVVVSGNYAYVANYYGLAIFDVTIPTAPALKGSAVDLAGLSIYLSNSISLSGNYAYVTSQEGLGIIDVSNLTAPIVKGLMTNGTGGASMAGPWSVYVSGIYAYVVSNSNALEIVDVSNPAAPKHRSSLADGSGGAKLQSPKSVFVSGNYAYVASGNNNGTLEIIDVTNPSVPVHKGSISDGTAMLNGAWSVYVVGQYAYVASNGSNALEIVDITNPAAPVHKGSLASGGAVLLNSPRSVFVSGNYAYVASFGNNALEIIDVTIPAVPVHKGSISDGSGGALLQAVNSVFVSGNYAYLGSNSAFEVVDVTNPAAPVHKGSLANGTGGALLGGQATVYVSGNYAYVVSGSDALEIINVTNPAAPVHYASLTDGTNGVALAAPYSIFVSGNYAYAVSWSLNSLQIVFLDSPSITGFTSSGQVGSSITITGQNFDTFVSVAINGIPATITGVTATALNVTVPSGATTGQLSIGYTGFKVTSNNNFIVTPTAATATNLQQTSFTANWSDTGIGGYLNGKYFLDVSTDNFNTYVGTYNNFSVGKVISYSVTGLNPGTTYQLRVRSTDGTTVSGNSNAVSILTIPATPTANVATAISQTGFTANWGLVANASGYFLDVASDAGFASMIPGYNNLSLSSSAVSQIVSGLNSGTYYYRVRSANGSGSSPSSSTVTAFTIPANPVATAATSTTSTSFIANWSGSAGATGYYLDVSTDNFATFVPSFNNANVGAVITSIVSGLSAGTSYQYRIRANNTSGTSGSSNITSVLTIPASPPSLPASSITNNSFIANWTKVTGATTYYLDVSTVSNFSTTIIGNLQVGNAASYTVSAGITASTTYYYRVRANNATGNSADWVTPVTVITLAAPATNQATAIAFLNLSSNSFTISFSPGNGTSHLVVASAGSPLNSLPSNQTSYTASSVFASGSAIGNGYVVSAGVGTSVTVTNLAVATIYYFQDFDFNGSGGATENYNTGTAAGNPNSQTSLAVLPTTQPTSLVFSNVTSSSTTASFTAAAGAPAGYLVLRASGGVPNTAPSNGTTYSIGAALGNATVTNIGASLNFLDAGLPSGTTYNYNVYSYNGSGATLNYMITAPLQGSVLTIPASPTTNPASATTATAFTANWTSVSGAANYYLDVSTDNFNTFVSGYSNINVGAVTSDPLSGLASGTLFQFRVRASNTSGTSANSNSTSVLTLPAVPPGLPATVVTQTSFTANWSKVTGATVYYLDVSSNSGFTSFVITNFAAGDVASYIVSGLSSTPATYYYRVRSFNSTGTNLTNSNVVSVTTLAAPVSTQSSALVFSNIASTSLTLTFTPGSGTSYLVVASAGTSLSANPSNLTSYAANATYGSGSAIGNGYVVGANSSASVNITGLILSTTYYFQVFDFNGSGGSENYKITTSVTNPANQTTPALLPSAQPTGLTFTNVTTASIAVSLTAAAGSPAGYLVLRSSGSAPNLLPSNGATYSIGSTLGNAIVASVGAAVSFFDAGLSSSTPYYYNVCAYNGNGLATNYRIVTPLQGNVLTVPYNPVTNPASAISSSGFTASWTKDASASSYLDVSADNFITLVAGYNNLNVGSVVSNNITGLASGTPYQYRVRAFNASWTSGNSNSTSLLTLPAAPQATFATSVSHISFTATWVKVAGATAYFVDVASDNAFAQLISGNTPVGNASSFIVNGLTPATTYYYRVRANDQTGTSSNSNPISVTTLATPVTTQSYALNFSNVSSTSVTLNFTPGSAGASHLAVASAGSPLITALPVNQTSYSANAAYGLGSAIGNGFVVGIGNSPVTINNLDLATTYYFQVFDFSGSGGTENYLTSTASNNPASQSTLATTSAAQPTNLTFSNITTIGATVSFTAATGNPAGYLVLRSTNSALPSPPANGTTYAVGNSIGNATVGYAGSSQSFIDGALAAGTTYYYNVYSYNGNGSTIDYLITNPLQGSVITLSPSPTASTASLIGSSSFTANWTVANGASDYYLDVSIDNFNTFVSGYNNLPVGSTMSYNVIGLFSGISYQYRVRAHNVSGTSGNSNATSLLSLPSAPPGLTASGATQNSFSASWTKVTAANSYYLDVAADSLFSTITYANITVGNSTSYSVSGLSSSTTYYFRVRAGDATGVSANSRFLPVTTLAAPVTTQSSALTFTNASSTSLTLNFTPGSGSAHLVVVSATSALTAVPLNRISYTANTAYGQGDPIGNGYVVTAGSPVTVTNLSPSTTYYFQVFDFNGSAGTQNYSITGAAKNPASQSTLATIPSAQPTNLTFSNQTASSVTASYAAATGSPAGYLVLRSSGASPSAPPVQGVTYAIGSTLGNATVSYSGPSLSFFDGGLPTSTKYFYLVYAYNGSGTSISYRTATPLQGSVTLDVNPPVISAPATPNPPTINGGNTPTFNATITDEVSVASAQIFYKGITRGSFKSAALNPSGAAGNYSIQIQTSWYDSLGLEYYFMATDENGNTTVRPVTTSFAQLVTPSITLPTLPSGTDQNSYRIVTFPYKLENNNNVTTIYSGVPWNDNKKARMFWWDPTAHGGGGSYVEYGSAFTTMEPGKGYWVLASVPITPTLTNVPASLNSRKNLYSMRLEAGWNMIGNPYPTPISWDDVKALNPNANISALNVYSSSGTYETATKLDPFTGGFVKNSGSAIAILIPFLGQSTVGGRTFTAGTDLSSESWNISLGIRQDNYDNRLGGFGMDPQAQPGPDRYDNFNPPQFVDVPEVNFTNKEYPSVAFSNDMVRSQANYIWGFIPFGRPGKVTQLHWNADIVSGSQQLFLLDEEQVKVIDMRSVSTYDFTMASSSRFRIFYGNNIESKVTTFSIAASTPYPNPLTSESRTTINLSLPDTNVEYKVSFQLYNGQGTMTESVNKILSPGIHQLEFTFDKGSITGGLYVYRLAVASDNSSQVYTGKIVKP